MLQAEQQRVEQAERTLLADRDRLQAHTAAFRRAGRDLLTPTRLVLGGLTAGYLFGRLWARRARRSTAAPAPADAPPSPLETLVRGMNLAAAAMPMLMPLIARKSAEKAVPMR